jgi:hypothetical protein
MKKIIIGFLCLISLNINAAILKIDYNGLIETDTNFQGEEGFPNLFEIGDSFVISLIINLDSFLGQSFNIPGKQITKSYSDYSLIAKTEDGVFTNSVGASPLRVIVQQRDAIPNKTEMGINFDDLLLTPNLTPIQEIIDAINGSAGYGDFSLRLGTVDELLDLASDDWIDALVGKNVIDNAASTQLNVYTASGQRAIAGEGTMMTSVHVPTPSTVLLFALGLIGIRVNRLGKDA